MPAGDRTGAGAPTGIVMNESDALGQRLPGNAPECRCGKKVPYSVITPLFESGWSMGVRNNFLSSLSKDNPKYEWNDSAQNQTNKCGFVRATWPLERMEPFMWRIGTILIVGGHQMKDREAYGRIYRIAPKNKKLVSPKGPFQQYPWPTGGIQ